MLKRWLCVTGLAMALALPAGTLAAAEAKASKEEKKRAEIDLNTKESLDKLYKVQPEARGLIERSYGYAVFHNAQAALLISSGSGSGVAVNRKSGRRTYMKMLSAGVGVGLGFQVMDVVFVFETEGKFNDFVNKGWDADTSAGATAATKGINQGASFIEGMAIFQMADAGLIAQASLKGTKYQADKKLNVAKK